MSYSTTGNPEVANLFRQAQRGDAASLTRLMDQHDGLVHYILRRQWCGSLSYTEVLQEGRIGLWRAIPSTPLRASLGFDPERGVAFSTYASVAIARQIWRAVVLRRAEDRAWAENEAQSGTEAVPTLPPFDPLPHLLAREVQGALRAQVQALPAKQRWIVCTCYGLDGQGSRTLTQLGRELGCTRQAVTYHLRRALVHLHHPAFSAHLRALLGRNRREDYRQAIQRRRGPS
jgi:RNA polymerase sigma factor (sigma-70 family)